MVEHNHSLCCEHDAIKFCKKCGVPYCERCGKEWVEKSTLGYFWYWPTEAYPIALTPSIPYTWTGSTTVFYPVNTGICEHSSY